MPNSHILSPTTDPFNPFGAADHQHSSYTNMASLAFSTAWAQSSTTPYHRPTRPMSVIGASPRCPAAQSTTVDASHYRSQWQHPPAAVPPHAISGAPDANFPTYHRPPTSNLSHVLSTLFASRASSTNYSSNSHFSSSEGIQYPSSATTTTVTAVPRTLESNIRCVPRPEYQTFIPSSSSCSPYAHMDTAHMTTAMEPAPSAMASFVPPFGAGGGHALGPIVARDISCIHREPGLTDPSLDLPVQDVPETSAITMTRRRQSSAYNSFISRPTSSLSSSSFSSSQSLLLSTSPQSTSSLSSMASSPPKAPLDLADMSRATTAVVARRPPSQTSKGSAAATLQRRHRSCSVASSTTSTDSAPSVKSCLSSAAVAMASSSPPAPAAAVLTSSTKSGQQQQQQQRGKHSSLLPPHQHQQLQQQLNYKTEYCTRFQESGGHCPFGDRCQFAHDASELQRRPRSLTYKTRPCWSGDSCLYQQNHQRCIYLHGSETPEMFDEQRGITFAKVQQICAKKAMKQQQQQQQTKSKLKNDQRLSMPAIPSPSMTAPPKNPLLSATTQQDATTATAASSSSSRRRIHRSQTLPSMTPVEAAASGIPASIQSATDAVQRKQDAQDHMTVALLPPPPPHPSAATALQEQEQLQSDSAHHTNNGRVMSWLFTDQANQQPQPSQQSACSRRKPFEALSNLRTTSTDEGGAVDGSDSASGSLPSFPQGYDLVSDAPSSSSSSSLPREPISRTTSTSAAPQQGQSMQVFQKPTFLSRSNRWSKSGAKKACPPKALSLSSLAEEELLSPARSAARLASPALALMHTLRTPTRPTVSGAAATVGMPVIGSHYAVLPVPVGASASASAAPVAATYDPFSMKTMMMMPMLPPSMSMPMPGQPMPLLPPQPLMNTNHHNKSMMMMTMTTGFPGATAMSMHSKTDRSLLFSPGTPLTDMIPVLGLEQLESWKDICFDD